MASVSVQVTKKAPVVVAQLCRSSLSHHRNAPWRRREREFVEAGQISNQHHSPGCKSPHFWQTNYKQTTVGFPRRDHNHCPAVPHVSHLVMLWRKQVAMLRRWQAAIKWRDLIWLNAEHRKSLVTNKQDRVLMQGQWIAKPFENM